MKKLFIILAVAAVCGVRAEVYVIRNHHPGLIRTAVQALGDAVTAVVGGNTTTVIETGCPVVAQPVYRPVYQPVYVTYPAYNPYYIGNPYYYGYGCRWGHPGYRPRWHHPCGGNRRHR